MILGSDLYEQFGLGGYNISQIFTSFYIFEVFE